MADEQAAKDPAEIILAAISDTALPISYMNGFVAATSAGDISLIMMRNGKIIHLVNMSFSVAKSLVLDLGTNIAAIESATGNSIMTVQQIAEAQAKQNNASE